MISGFITENLPIRPAAGVPEIRLHQAAPGSGLRRLADSDPDLGPPYWSRPWGGGLALARHILDRPETVRGRGVLDVGTGSGLVAIAAALAGADVSAVDVDPHAVAAARLNAALNDVRVGVEQADLLDRPAPDAEVVLVGDLFYEAALAKRVLGFLQRCRAAGAEVLIGDPWRRTLPKGRLVRLADYEVEDFGAGQGPAAVFRLED